MKHWNLKKSRGDNLIFTFRKKVKKEETIAKNALFQLVDNVTNANH